MPFADNLRTEFADLHSQTGALLDVAEREGRPLTDEERAANETRFSRLTAIQNTLSDHTRFAGLALEQGQAQTPREPPGRDELRVADGLNFANLTPEVRAEIGRRHHEAVNRYIRTGEAQASNQFTLTTGSGSGVLLPTTIGVPVVIKRQVNPFRAALLARGLTVIRTDDSGAMSVPVFDDGGNTADVIAQDSTSENNKDPAVTGLTLGADLYDSGTVWSSNTLLNSLNFDLLAYLQPMLDVRIAVKEYTAWAASLVAGATVGVTTATTNGVTYDELLNWQHSIPVERRVDGVFVLSDGLFRAIRGLKDSTGHPIYQESLRDEAPDTLLGWPVFPTSALAAPAANVVSGIAASASSLVVRDVNNRRVARYTNIPTHPDQFGLRMFSNGGFAFAPGGVRALKHAAA